MTALEQYARLETTGLWRPAPGAQRREVVVSFGEATLVIADSAGRALSHWSLAAVIRLNPGAAPALYAPDTAGDEELEIADDLMTGAIDKVLQVVGRRQRPPARIGRRFVLGLSALVALAGVLWLPDALRRQTVAIVPPAQATEIGARLLGLMSRTAGPPCRGTAGTAALSRLSERLFGPGGGQIVVLPDGPAGPVLLPGRIVVLPFALIAATDDPLVIAGHAVATHAAGAEVDPLLALLRESGPGAVFALLATGTLGEDRLLPRARTLLAEGDARASTDRVLAAFARASLPLAPWVLSLSPAPPDAAALLAGDTLADASDATVMPDSDWISLLGICGG
jgi:hypothetical protein